MLLALLCGSTFVKADILMLKNGTKVEGSILQQNDQGVRMKYKLTPKIMDEKVFTMAEIAQIIKQRPEEVEVIELRKVLPTPDLVKADEYEQIIQDRLRPFVNKYAGTPEAKEVEGIIAKLQEEKTKVSNGQVKLEGKWLSPKESKAETFNVEAFRIFSAMRKKAAKQDYVGALREFDLLMMPRPAYTGSPYFVQAIPEALALLDKWTAVLDKMASEQPQLAKVREDGLTKLQEPDLSPDSKAKRTADMIEGFGFAVLNRRFERLGRAANPPFTDGGAFVDTLYDTQKRVDIDMTGQPGRWREALTAAITEQRRMVQFGVTKAELDREIAEARTGLVASVQRASTRSTPGLANMIAGSVDASAVVTNPQQDLDFFNEAVRQVTVDSVNAAMRQAFAGAGPLAFIGTPTPIEGGASAVTDALNTALAAPVTPGETVAVKTWPYTRFGTPGKVKDSQVVADLDTTFIQFENGVRLTVKPTTFRKDQILVSVRLGAGMLAFPNNKTPADWALSGTFMEGGLKDLTAEEVERIMADKVVGVSMGAGENSTSFSGGTRGADLDTEMQMLAAYVTAPGWRPEGFQRIKTTAGTSHDQQDATAGGVLGRELNAMLRAGDRRWGFPTREEIAAAQLSDVKALVENDLANGPVEIIIVGDTTVAKATAAVAATFGALPKRPTQAWKAPPAPVVNFPAPTPAPVTLTHKGRADDSEGFIAWKTNDFFADVHEARSLRVAAAIMDNRLVEELREKQGATYSPSASSLADSVFPGYGFVAASVETPPDNLPGFFSTVESVAADLRDKLVSDDELNRAKAPMIEATQRNFNSSNEFWLTQLTDAQTDPRHLTAIRSAMADLRTISAADVQAAARKYLLAGRAWKLQVRAAPAASGPRQ